MAYDTTKLVKLAALKSLAEKINSDFATKDELSTLQTTVDGIVATGGEANVIETVKVNGTALEVTDKAVDVTVPTAVSELTNDSEYQTATEVASSIATAISESGHASFEVVESVPDADSAEENVLYLVMNSDTGYYDVYALISGSVVRIDDTSIDLSGYYTSAEVDTLLAAKADAFEVATDDEVSEMLTEVFDTEESSE